MGYTYTKKEALRIIISTAKEYKNILDGKNFLFVYRDRKNNKIEFFETVFLPRNYQHLTGIEFLDKQGKSRKNSVLFYKKCLSNTLTMDEIAFKQDGTTPLKLAALPKLVNFIQYSNITALYNGAKPRLTLDRVAGTTNYCIGFSKSGNYYVPSSCLLEDVRKLSDTPSQILAIMSKSAIDKEKIYKDIRYQAKGVCFEKINLPLALKKLLN